MGGDTPVSGPCLVLGTVQLHSVFMALSPLHLRYLPFPLILSDDPTLVLQQIIFRRTKPEMGAVLRFLLLSSISANPLQVREHKVWFPSWSKGGKNPLGPHYELIAG